MKVFIVLFSVAALASAQSGTGKTTRYWDCCKPSCSWPGKATVSKPVATCNKDGVTTVDSNAVSGCNGGNAYVCNNQQPFNVSDVGYGFAAASIVGNGEAQSCCSCYQLTFTSGPITGKKMIVQVTNSGGDLGANHFDLMIPGGGVGLFNGCTSQWGAPSPNGWGSQYGGISSASQCNQLPSQLQQGCLFRFGWFQNSDNPTMTFNQVTCPALLTSKSGCVRS